MKNNKKIYYGAIILGIGAFLSKLLGAVYRIPLTRLIGGSGLGLYQTVFPVYTLLLDFSGAGVPNAMAKLISSRPPREREVYALKLLKISLLFFCLLGALFSVVTAALSRVFAAAQGCPEAYSAYITLSPSVFLVCAICCFRGYFQGFMNMTATASSQITEQAVKLAVGLIAARAFLPDIPKAVAAATFAITVSEAVALIMLIITFAVRRKKSGVLPIKLNKKEAVFSLKEIISYAVPIALTGMILPLSKVLDSFIIVNSLKLYSENATGLYGLFSGVAATVIGLPVAICYGVATVAVPAVSGGGANRNDKAKKTVLLTLVLSLPAAIFCALFAPFIVGLLFGYLGAEEKSVSVTLLRITSPCIVLLSLLQTLNAVLIGKGMPKKPAIGTAAGVAVKTAAEIVMLKNPAVGVYGAGIASIACYFVANLVNLTMAFPIKRKRGENDCPRIKIGVYNDT